MTVQQYVAGQTRRMAEALAHFVDTTATERLGWQPNAEGGAETRSALEQAAECVGVNRMMAALLRGEAVQGRTEPKLTDAADARSQLLDSADELARAIEAASDADLAREYRHPRGVMLGENLILMGYRNMAYHAGQINLIQMLCGDAEFHVPANWR